MMPSGTVSENGVKFSVEVAATAHWVDTELTVDGDRTVSLRPTSGSWTANPHTGRVGAAGHPTLRAHSGYVLAEAPEGLLVGRIGDRVFPIGDGATVPAGATGRLYLSINDDISGEYGAGFEDNEGSLIVEITVVSSAGPPGPGMRFRDDGSPIPSHEVVPGAHATEDIDGFAGWLDGARQEVVERVHAALEAAPAPTRSDAIARSRAKLVLVAAGTQREQAENALGKLLKNQWWKLFIDRGAQDRSSQAPRTRCGSTWRARPVTTLR